MKKSKNLPVVALPESNGERESRLESQDSSVSRPIDEAPESAKKSMQRSASTSLALESGGGQPPSPKPKRRLERNAEHQKYVLRDGSVVGGASSICRMGDSPEPLIRWANRMGLEGKDSTKFRDKAADVGHIFHFMVACFMENAEPDFREYDDKDIRKAELGFAKFMDFWTKERLVCVASEKQMVSEVWRYGGTLDIVARDEDGLLALLDEKSSKAVYWSQKCQLAGYEQLWNENNDEQISRRAILRTPPTDEGEFQVHWINDTTIKRHIRIFQAQAALFNVIKDRS